MVKFTWKQKILLSLITALTYALAITLLQGNFSEINYSIIALKAGVFGLVFGLLYYPFLQYTTNKRLSKIEEPELDESDEILFSDAASLYKKSWNAIGGKLFITKKRIIFISYWRKSNRIDMDINRQDISLVSKRKSMSIVNNVLLIKCNDGNEYKLMVNHRDDILALLESGL